jgi:hypothetical protein
MVTNIKIVLNKNVGNNLGGGALEGENPSYNINFAVLC